MALTGEIGFAWLVATDELTHFEVAFLRESKYWINVLHSRYSVLWNYVDARNKVHIRWLDWCGFMLVDRIEAFGPEARLFFKFSRMRESVLSRKFERSP